MQNVAQDELRFTPLALLLKAVPQVGDHPDALFHDHAATGQTTSVQFAYFRLLFAYVWHPLHPASF